jgi:hypothetical protein
MMLATLMYSYIPECGVVFALFCMYHVHDLHNQISKEKKDEDLDRRIKEIRRMGK